MFRFNFLQPARWPVGRRSLLLAVLLSLLPFSVYADSPPTYITEWTGFNFPAGVVVDSSDNVYVADTNNHRIVKLSSTGDSRTVWTGFSFPHGMAVDSSGNVYVADFVNHRIVKLSSTGDSRTEWTGFNFPAGVAVDSSDNVYVADTSNGRIVKLSSTGAYLTEWTGFDNPYGVAVDSSGNVYVADTNNHRIVKLSSTGDSRTVWTGFNLPKGVAVDSRDNVYVADTNNTRIVKYSSTGAYLTEWGVWGVFKYPGGVAVDSSDNVYVADTSNGRIVKYGSTNLKVDGAGVSLVNGNQVNVPVKFAGNGKQIASVGFVLNYDTACLAFDPTDNNEDDIPDAITGLPAAFIPSISHNTNQKLEVALYSNPVATLTDGTLFTVQFTVNANCLPDAATPTKTMTVGFDASPAPSFGDAGGADVDGTTTDGTITLTYGNSAPTDLALSNNKVTDGSAAGTTVGTLSTLDLDSGDSFTYSFSNSANCPNTDNASFTLTGNTLQTAVAIDYATKSSYTICLRSTDSGGIFVERSFTILVIGTPVAVDDLVEPRTKVLLSGETQVIDVLANDQAKGATLSVASITQPAAGKGSATNNNTNVSYSAPATGNGTARFTYQATNGDFTSTSANVDVSYVANDLRGDCNANGSVTAADFIATVLEIFDSSDDNKDAAGKPAWWLIYNGSYAGSPRGCDSNGLGNGTDLENLTASVTAADITCTVLIFFGHPCGGGLQAASADQVAGLSVAAVATGGQTTIPVTLATRGQAVAAAAFALELGNATFDASDADGNGIPDAVTLTLPAGVMKSVVWNAQAQRLEVALYGVSLPLTTLADGVLATVTVDGTATPALTQVSLSDTNGNDLPLNQETALRTGIFLPLIMR